MARLPRLPDLLTTANLSCGVGSILLASQGQLTWACWLVFIGAAFDVLDGLAARALGGGSELGKQLDSLADMVTFGVAPAFIASINPARALHHVITPQRDYLPSTWSVPGEAGYIFSEPLWMAFCTALVITIGSAWRLAKFNIDTRQTTGFLGLATPANALFWASLGLVAHGVLTRTGPFPLDHLALRFTHSPLLKLVAAFALALLMLSSIPLPSLKFKHMGWKGNEVIYLLIGIGALLIALYGILAVPLILIIYLLSPLWGRLFPKTQEN